MHAGSIQRTIYTDDPQSLEVAMAISEEELNYLQGISDHCDPPPWQSWVEGRDGFSGDSFIMTGEGSSRGEDIYVTRDSGPAAASYLDLIAAARTYLPLLIEEIRDLRSRGS